MRTFDSLRHFVELPTFASAKTSVPHNISMSGYSRLAGNLDYKAFAMHMLVLSDIHNNVGNVRIIREEESNEFDAVIVGGDIGDETAIEFFAVIDTFKCPAYCVYGNWDNGLEYSRTLSANCMLVHHTIEQLGDYLLSGFSGCPTSWGQNPEYLDAMRGLQKKHRTIVEKLKEGYELLERRTAEIEAAHAEVVAELKYKYRVLDQRKVPFRNKIKKVEQDKTRALDRADRLHERVYTTRAFQSYEHERRGLTKLTLDCNRAKLFQVLKASGVDERKLILLTHERLTRIAEEGIRPLIHIFGHRHEYTFREFKGTHYLNAAAVDSGFSSAFGRLDPVRLGYCKVTLVGSDVLVTRKHLSASADSVPVGH